MAVMASIGVNISPQGRDVRDHDKEDPPGRSGPAGGIPMDGEHHLSPPAAISIAHTIADLTNTKPRVYFTYH